MLKPRRSLSRLKLGAWTRHLYKPSVFGCIDMLLLHTTKFGGQQRALLRAKFGSGPAQRVAATTSSHCKPSITTNPPKLSCIVQSHARGICAIPKNGDLGLYLRDLASLRSWLLHELSGLVETATGSTLDEVTQRLRPLILCSAAVID